MRCLAIIFFLSLATVAGAQNCATYGDQWIAATSSSGGGVAVAMSSNRIVTLASQTMRSYSHDGTASTPPPLEGTFALPFQRFGDDVALDGNAAFVLTNVDLYAISLTGTPGIIDTIELPAQNGGSYAALTGDHLAVHHDGNLRIVDVGNPHQMSVLATVPVASQVDDVAADGSLVVLATDTGVLLYDIDDPNLPAEIPNSLTGAVRRVALRGSSLVVGRPGSGLGPEIYDLTSPASPTMQSSLPGFPGSQVASVHLANDRLTVVEPSSPYAVVRLWDVSDPMSPEFLEESCYPARSATASPRAVTNGQLTVAILDGLYCWELGIAPVAPPSPIGSLSVPLGEGPTTLLRRQDRLYIAEFSSSGQVLILDATDPSSPQLLGSMPLIADADNRGLGLRGSTLLVPAGEDLLSIDVSDPTEPQVVDSITASNKIYDMAVDGDWAYLAVRDGIEVVSLGSHQSTGIVELPPAQEDGDLGAIEVATSGTTLFCTTRVQYFPPDSPIETRHFVVDISVPASPVWVSLYESDTPARGLSTDGGSIVIGDAAVLQFDGTQLGAYSTAEVPFQPGPEPLDVSSDGSLIAAVRGTPSLALYSRNPIAGLAAVTIDPQVPLTGVLVTDQGVHVTGVGQYWLLPRPCEAMTAVDPLPGGASFGIVAPCPYVPGARIQLATARPGLVALDVYDVRGRRVATLGQRYLQAGSHVAVWDGMNDHGQRVARGIYYLRAGFEGASRTARLTVVW